MTLILDLGHAFTRARQMASRVEVDLQVRVDFPTAELKITVYLQSQENYCLVLTTILCCYLFRKQPRSQCFCTSQAQKPQVKKAIGTFFVRTNFSEGELF